MSIEKIYALDTYITEHKFNSMSEGIIAIFVEKLKPLIPGLCLACDYQNPVDADYCCNCGKKIEVIE